MNPATEWPPRPWNPPDEADELGLVGIGGDLSVSMLLRAYSWGIFPWFSEGEPVAWWSPDPRAVFPLDGIRVSTRLARTIRSGKFRVTYDRCFTRVIVGCAQRDEGTWVTTGMMEAYRRLHNLGHAHSLETWVGDDLAGGIYGVSIGGLFAAESMFYKVADASKVALVALGGHLAERGYTLLDTQMLTDHTTRMGAVTIPRSEYLTRLREAVQVRPQAFGKE